MTNKIRKKDSPETRRKIPKVDFDFSSFKKDDLVEKDPIKRQHFLEWFLGFFEAEGSFISWESYRYGIEISQKDEKVIKKLQANINLGYVQKIQRTEIDIYWRFIVNKRKDLKQIIALVNGNLILDKRQFMFKKWLSNFNKLHRTNFLFKDRTPEISLNDAWLSGFLEGDGGFWVRGSFIRKNRRTTDSYAIHMKFYVTQKESEQILAKIIELFEMPTKVRVRVNFYKNSNTGMIIKRKYNRIETSAKNSHNIVVTYLARFPFLGARQLTIENWQELMKIRNLGKKGYPITQENSAYIQNLIQKQAFVESTQEGITDTFNEMRKI